MVSPTPEKNIWLFLLLVKFVCLLQCAYQVFAEKMPARNRNESCGLCYNQDNELKMSKIRDYIELQYMVMTLWFIPTSSPLI